MIDIMGGVDGLSVVAPYGDPDLAKLRGQIMAPAVGKRGGMLDLGGFFGLHPAMTNLHAMFAAGEARHGALRSAMSNTHAAISRARMCCRPARLRSSEWLARPGDGAGARQ